ncbi:MAG: hypothetical protein MAG431_01850 [Chloroflexi bacterium]|nr:hypothetical protein [Chloroflexota bacterium]
MVTTATVNIQLDAEAARIYQRASSEEKQKMQVLLSLWLREFGKPTKSLHSLMDEISDKAQLRGMTPEVLGYLLNDECPRIT